MTEVVTLNWVGGTHDFQLNLGALRAVQNVCNAGPQEVLMRLMNNTWRIDDPIEVLRQALMGGGMARAEASDIVLRMADLFGLLKLISTATFVLTAALVGVQDDVVGGAQGETLPPESGSSVSSTDGGPAPVSPPVTSTP